MLRPCWLFVVGPAAAGKTTIGQHLLRHLPGFILLSDLAVLTELFARNEKEGEKPEAELGYYWHDLKEDRVVGAWRTECLSDGGHDILDPRVWDEALRRLVQSKPKSPRMIVEFARGFDPAYMALHGISAEEAYVPSFRLLADELAGVSDAAIGIVHVEAPFSVRFTRNAVRRSLGHHYVAEEIMRTVYRHDLFLESAVEPLRAAGRNPVLYRVSGLAQPDETARLVAEWVHKHLS